MTIAIDESSKTKTVIISYTKMFVLGVGIVFAAIFIASILNQWRPVSPLVVRMFEYLGYIGWCATLGMSNIQTWGRKTFSEWLDNWLAKVFSVVGIFSFVLARELVPFE